ncbi:hypothetical protein JCM3774_003761 [Rhodotorula dairenensis]
MEWTNSWSTVADDHHRRSGPRGDDFLVPQTAAHDSVSPTSRSPSPYTCGYNVKSGVAGTAAAVSNWIETAALDGDFSLDGDGHLCARNDAAMEMEIDSLSTEDAAAAESGRRNSLGLTLDLRDLQSLVLSCSLSDKAPLHSRPYPSPVSPATTLFLRSNASPAASSVASETDSYFDYERPRQLSTATSVGTSAYVGGDDADGDCGKEAWDLPPSPDLVPFSLPPVPVASLSELPPAPPAPVAPSHPLHRGHRLSMTPVDTSASQLELPTVPESASQQQPSPPRLRKSSLVDLPPMVPLSGAAETGLQPLPPTPPRSPTALLRMTTLPACEALRPLASPASPATRPRVASDSVPQSSKWTFSNSQRQRRQ